MAGFDIAPPPPSPSPLSVEPSLAARMYDHVRARTSIPGACKRCAIVSWRLLRSVDRVTKGLKKGRGGEEEEEATGFEEVIGCVSS